MAKLDDAKLLEIIKELDLINETTLKSAIDEAKLKTQTLEETLIKQNLIPKETLGQLVADNLKFPYINLDATEINKNAANSIPEIFAKQQYALAFKNDKDGIHIALNDPTNELVTSSLTKKFATQNIKFYYTTIVDLQNNFVIYTKNLDKKVEEIIKQFKTLGSSEFPIIDLVDTIFKYAYQNRTSDIHMEPLEENSVIRFRIDGILHDIVTVPLDLHNLITTRIKIMASMRTDEHNNPQDGKVIFDMEEEELDLRVSTVPTVKGESVVLRLLAENHINLDFGELGFGSHEIAILKEASSKSDGMILCTGPTGSGKTTTLYAVLKSVYNRELNIMTIEDPVEYELDGINQIQVNLAKELTFAKGLRSIVRQDPDIILVGEIRDPETADIAVNSAMTGHLVLSTLHANDAATTIPRLIELGVEPFLISSTVDVIIAQRLVRKICTNCRVSLEIDLNKVSDSMKEHLKNKKEFKAYKGKGCEVCNHSGYNGRIALIELLKVNEEIKELIAEQKDSHEITKAAVKAGMKTLVEDGLNKVEQGETTIEEVVRVTQLV